MLQVQATLGSVSQTKDGCCRFSVHTQEITNDEKLELLNSAGLTGWLLFKEDEKEFDIKDIPKENTSIESKSLSERLRGVQFIVWKQSYEVQYPNFEEWRRKQMEGLIQQYKDKIED